MAETYRWNAADQAAAYDAAAEFIHPHYLEIQETILNRIARPAEAEFQLVDLGGGSGRLAEKFLARFPRARAIVIDQSAPFLDIARRRLERYEGRAACFVARLQDDWSSQLSESATVITSMSAIHHLDPGEKRALYQQVYAALAPLGLFLNGDEVRDADDATYLATMEAWAAHMRHIVASGQVGPEAAPMLEKWQERNVTRFGEPRNSGDDCHETVEAQLGYLADCGFRSVGAPWRKEMWALLEATK